MLMRRSACVLASIFLLACAHVENSADYHGSMVGLTDDGLSHAEIPAKEAPKENDPQGQKVGSDEERPTNKLDVFGGSANNNSALVHDPALLPKSDNSFQGRTILNWGMSH